MLIFQCCIHEYLDKNVINCLIPGHVQISLTLLSSLMAMHFLWQVIVIALDNWEVLCYDSELRLLWRRQLMDVGDMREHHVIKSFAVFIVPQSLRSGDNGTVIVGGNFGHMERDDMK